MDAPTPFQAPLEQQPSGLKFAQMNGTQKAMFMAKLVACIATFGFAFPNVQHD
jgi:hypothetical protein